MNYDKLVRTRQRLHFTKAHFMCPDPDCQANRFVVFTTAYDLQDHNVTTRQNFVHYRRETRTQKFDLSSLGC
jgi:hypothetical protein